jgi:hypothetical protein
LLVFGTITLLLRFELHSPLTILTLAFLKLLLLLLSWSKDCLEFLTARAALPLLLKPSTRTTSHVTKSTPRNLYGSFSLPAGLLGSL